jgi:hypothetical protein
MSRRLSDLPLVIFKAQGEGAGPSPPRVEAGGSFRTTQARAHAIAAENPKRSFWIPLRGRALARFDATGTGVTVAARPVPGVRHQVP